MQPVIKIAKLKASLYDSEGAEFRQQLLLQAKELCIEIIYLRQQQIFARRTTVQRTTPRLYINKNWRPGRQYFWKQNKISVELIAAQTAANLNATTLKARLQQLSNLAGGEPVNFTATDYPAESELPE